MLPRCLAAARDAVDEIIVVDTGSTDRTVEIAESFGAKVIEQEWTGSFADARNVSFDAATGDWIMYLDADEVLVADDAERLRELTGRTWREAFYLVETNFTGELGDGTAVTHNALRVFRNRPEYRFEGRIHEQIAHTPAGEDARAHRDHRRPRRALRLPRRRSRRQGQVAPQHRAARAPARRGRGPDRPFLHFNLGSEYAALGENEQRAATVRARLGAHARGPGRRRLRLSSRRCSAASRAPAASPAATPRPPSSAVEALEHAARASPTSSSRRRPVRPRAGPPRRGRRAASSSAWRWATRPPATRPPSAAAPTWRCSPGRSPPRAGRPRRGVGRCWPAAWTSTRASSGAVDAARHGAAGRGRRRRRSVVAAIEEPTPELTAERRASCSPPRSTRPATPAECRGALRRRAGGAAGQRRPPASPSPRACSPSAAGRRRPRPPRPSRTGGVRRLPPAAPSCSRGSSPARPSSPSGSSARAAADLPARSRRYDAWRRSPPAARPPPPLPAAAAPVLATTLEALLRVEEFDAFAGALRDREHASCRARPPRAAGRRSTSAAASSSRPPTSGSPPSTSAAPTPALSSASPRSPGRASMHEDAVTLRPPRPSPSIPDHALASGAGRTSRAPRPCQRASRFDLADDRE